MFWCKYGVLLFLVGVVVYVGCLFYILLFCLPIMLLSCLSFCLRVEILVIMLLAFSSPLRKDF